MLYIAIGLGMIVISEDISRLMLKKDNNHQAETVKISPFSEIDFVCHYPQENPKDFIESITDAMSYIGLFDHIKVQNPKSTTLIA